MLKPSKQNIIDEIIKEIEKGKGRGDVLAKSVKKWQISNRSFDRYWKIANQQQQERQQKASKAADAVYIMAKQEAAKEAVMSKAERLEVLSKIARGTLTVMIPSQEGDKPKEESVFIETLERIKAIAELNKMEGDYAPTKNELTGADGAPLQLTTEHKVIFENCSNTPPEQPGE